MRRLLAYTMLVVEVAHLYSAIRMWETKPPKGKISHNGHMLTARRSLLLWLPDLPDMLLACNSPCIPGPLPLVRPHQS